MRERYKGKGTGRGVIGALCIAAAVVTACGCASATRQIERDQSRIEYLTRQSVHAIEQSIERINEAIESGEVERGAQTHLGESMKHQRVAIAHQQAIAAAADRTRSRLVHVEDRVHPVVRLAQTWGTVALIVAMIALLAYLGVGPLIRRAFQIIGLLIPRAVRSDAKFDAELIASGSACAFDRERIAARRAADAAYDRAFIRGKRRCEKESTDANLRAQTNP